MKLNKWLALILVFAMLSALIACGSDAKKDEPTTEPTTEAPTTETPTTESAATEEKKAVRGEISGNTYTNSAIGYTVTLGSEWTVANEAELAQMAGVTADMINNELAQQMIKGGQAVFDFYAAKDGGLSTLNINITSDSTGSLTSYDEETLLNMSMAGSRQVLEDSGFENLNMQLAPMTFAGEEHQCMALTATFNGLPIYEYMLMFASDTYIYTITACSYNEDVAADYLAFFTKIGEAAPETPTEETPIDLVITSDIVGDWNFPLPCAELMEQALLTTGVECDIDDNMTLLIKLTYNADGTFSMVADADSAKAMVDEMLRAMSGMMADLLYAEFEKQGWDKATTDAQLAAQGMTMDSLVEQSMAQADTSSLDFSTAMANESFYIVEGDVFYTAASMEDLLAGKYVDSTEFVIDGDQMQFLSCEIFNEDATSLEDLIAFPLTLTRQ